MSKINAIIPNIIDKGSIPVNDTQNKVVWNPTAKYTPSINPVIPSTRTIAVIIVEYFGNLPFSL